MDLTDLGKPSLDQIICFCSVLFLDLISLLYDTLALMIQIEMPEVRGQGQSGLPSGGSEHKKFNLPLKRSSAEGTLAELNLLPLGWWLLQLLRSASRGTHTHTCALRSDQLLPD